MIAIVCSAGHRRPSHARIATASMALPRYSRSQTRPLYWSAMGRSTLFSPPELALWRATSVQSYSPLPALASPFGRVDSEGTHGVRREGGRERERGWERWTGRKASGPPSERQEWCVLQPLSKIEKKKDLPREREWKRLPPDPEILGRRR